MLLLLAAYMPPLRMTMKGAPVPFILSRGLVRRDMDTKKEEMLNGFSSF